MAMHMENNKPQTVRKRPLPKRPQTGWMAWTATLGYISRAHSPDALLQFQVLAQANGQLIWDASISWEKKHESVHACDSLAEAFSELWQTVSQSHDIFQSPEDAIRQPAYYADDEWLDERTQTLLNRLIALCTTAFADDWSLMGVYQPVADTQKRVQMRLMVEQYQIHVGGRGATLQEACRQLYTHVAQTYSLRLGPTVKE